MENQPMQPIQSMEPKGKTILKVVGILLIIGAGLSLIGLLVSGWAYLLLGVLGILLLILSIVMVAFQLIAGIMAVKYCGNASKAHVCVVFGGILIGIAVLNLILALATNSFTYTNITGLILPALFLYGSMLNQKSA